jgi:hypothetical protein
VVTRLREPGGVTTADRQELSGVLVVRAWIEGDPPQFKARLTHTTDVTRHEEESATVSSARGIHDEIDRWLAALQAAHAR